MTQVQIKKESFIPKKTKQAFTLVELIIVITILAILATIWFVSMWNYLTSSRDSTRLTDMKSIYDAMSVYTVRTGETPFPDSDKLEVKNGSSILTYQWYVWDTVFRLIQLNNGWVDPKDKKNYVYTTDAARRKIQLMWYLETSDNVKVLGYFPFLNNTFADTNDLKWRYVYVYGDTLWILTDANKTPLQDVITWSGVNLLDAAQVPAGTTAYFGWDLYDSGKSTATGTTLVEQIVTSQNSTTSPTPSWSGCVLWTTFVLGSCSL